MKTILSFIFLVLFSTIASAQKAKRLTPKHPHEISVGYDNLFNFRFNGASLGYNYNWLPRKRFYVLTGAKIQLLVGNYPCNPNQMAFILPLPDFTIRTGYNFKPWLRWDIGFASLLGYFIPRLTTTPSILIGKEKRFMVSLPFSITWRRDLYDCRPFSTGQLDDVVIKPYTSLGLNMTYKL